MNEIFFVLAFIAFSFVVCTHVFYYRLYTETIASTGARKIAMYAIHLAVYSLILYISVEYFIFMIGLQIVLGLVHMIESFKS